MPAPASRSSLALSVQALLVAACWAQVLPRNKTLFAFLGSTPTIDGYLEPGEWEDAFVWEGIGDFSEQFSPTLPAAPIDHDLRLFVKRDNRSLFFAFVATDDTIYGVDTESWLPGGNPGANVLNQSGWPWFGDEFEILLNANNSWTSVNETIAGVDGRNWQMVANLRKSRLGGLGVGGLLEGEPRSSDAAWSNYRSWIESGAQRAAVSVAHGSAPYGGSTYTVEWAIDFDPCVELESGVFYAPPPSPDAAPTVVGINIAFGDVDAQAQGDPTYGLRHESWLSGATCAWTNCHTLLSEFGLLSLEAGPRDRGSRN